MTDDIRRAYHPSELPEHLMQAIREALVDPDAHQAAMIGRLAALRRLYHHLCCGGALTPLDDRRVGTPATKGNLGRLIRELEEQTQ